jgi:phosphatidylglycerophosphate synthase
MNTVHPAGRPPPTTLFPLIRHCSARITPLLARLPITANQITAVSLVVGLAAVWAAAQPGRPWALYCAGLLVISYVLDNCDGEIAALRGETSEFGAQFDTFVDWVINTGFFAALGIGTAAASGEAAWLWLGWFAAAGCTINYLLKLWLDVRKRRQGHPQEAFRDPEQPHVWKQWAVYILRELFRADFCFIVLVLAVFDLVWLLLPAAAIGAQAYWIAQLTSGAGDYHV